MNVYMDPGFMDADWEIGPTGISHRSPSSVQYQGTPPGPQKPARLGRAGIPGWQEPAGSFVLWEPARARLGQEPEFVGDCWEPGAPGVTGATEVGQHYGGLES